MAQVARLEMLAPEERLDPERLIEDLKTAGKEITAGDEPTSSTGESSDLRTGRWTPEEIAYCDKLIEHFSHGSLPIPEKLKLNDFLANMLKSKQSRLTKKMKNARFSAKLYVRKEGCTLNQEEARELSQLETDFLKESKRNGTKLYCQSTDGCLRSPLLRYLAAIDPMFMVSS